MGTIVNNNKHPVSYGYCVSDNEMHLEVALQNLRDQIDSLKRQISNLEAGLNLFINTLNND
jgi:hypothetical protein